MFIHSISIRSSKMTTFKRRANANIKSTFTRCAVLPDTDPPKFTFSIRYANGESSQFITHPVINRQHATSIPVPRQTERHSKVHTLQISALQTSRPRPTRTHVAKGNRKPSTRQDRMERRSARTRRANRWAAYTHKHQSNATISGNFLLFYGRNDRAYTHPHTHETFFCARARPLTRHTITHAHLLCAPRFFNKYTVAHETDGTRSKCASASTQKCVAHKRALFKWSVDRCSFCRYTVYPNQAVSYIHVYRNGRHMHVATTNNVAAHRHKELHENHTRTRQRFAVTQRNTGVTTSFLYINIYLVVVYHTLLNTYNPLRLRYDRSLVSVQCVCITPDIIYTLHSTLIHLTFAHALRTHSARLFVAYGAARVW